MTLIRVINPSIHLKYWRQLPTFALHPGFLFSRCTLPRQEMCGSTLIDALAAQIICFLLKSLH